MAVVVTYDSAGEQWCDSFAHTCLSQFIVLYLNARIAHFEYLGCHTK